jgi:precorrin-8X/cobalt-precorrin-8 methylmutase
VIEYLRDPEAIYARSFEIVRAESDFSRLPADAQDVAIRIVHACGMPDVARDLIITEGFASAARSALHAARPILVDSEMVRHGIVDGSVKIICTLNDPAARDGGMREKTTRSAAAVALWRPHLEGALAVVGNAPTALFALLELIDAGAPRPAAIVAFPVGFVGAAESKEELHRDPRGIPYATLLGRRGGSAMAAAVVNSLTDART